MTTFFVLGPLGPLPISVATYFYGRGEDGLYKGEYRRDEGDDGIDDVTGGAAVGGLGPLFGGAVDGPACRGRDHLGRDGCAGWMCGEAFEEHAAYDGDDGGLHVRLHLAGFGRTWVL
jgi:hypothetical protein